MKTVYRVGGQRRPEVSILGADQKDRGLWGLEWVYLSILEESVIMEAVAKHDFVPTAEDELAFKKGSILKVNGSQKCFVAQYIIRRRRNFHS